MQNIYESDKSVEEYLLFSFGEQEDILPYNFGPEGALHFHQRCVRFAIEKCNLSKGSRALDLGCAVGQASFELARYCSDVVGIDFSSRFIDTANKLKKDGAIAYFCREEGNTGKELVAKIPEHVDRGRVSFYQGDACNLSTDFGKFDVVLLINLIDRLSDPSKCVESLFQFLRPGGTMLIASPYTWIEEYTPSNHWLGGYKAGDSDVKTIDSLKRMLGPQFEFIEKRDLPFLIREHRRKYQWSVSEGSLWRFRH